MKNRYLIGKKIENGARCKCIFCDFTIMKGDNIFILTRHVLQYHTPEFNKKYNCQMMTHYTEITGYKIYTGEDDA